MIERRFNGFVCKKVNYNDNDAIFSVLTPERKEVFKARGILKVTSKNAPNCNYFMLSEFVCSSKTELSNQTLKSASSIKIYKKPYEDLLISSCYLFVCSLLDQVSEQINGYDIAIKCFDYLEDGYKPVSVINFFLKNLCDALGYQSNLYGCVNCNNKNNLISFDIESGGFICSTCFDSTRYEKMPSTFLKEVYSFLKSEDLYEMEDLKANKLLSLYATFLKDVVGLNMNSYDFMVKCI